MTNDYPTAYARAVKFHLDHVAALAATLSHAHWIGQGTPHSDSTEPEWTNRRALADALEEAGRLPEADLVRDLHNTIAHHNGQFKPGVVRYRQAVFDGGGDDADRMLDMIDDEGPEYALRFAQNNYDYGSGRLINEISSGSSDYRHHDGSYALSWNPRLGYWGLEEQHVLPEEHAHHNYRGENGSTLHVPEFDR